MTSQARVATGSCYNNLAFSTKWELWTFYASSLRVDLVLSRLSQVFAERRVGGHGLRGQIKHFHRLTVITLSLEG